MSDRSQAADSPKLHLAQARLLVERNTSSCLIVESVIVYLAVLMMLAGDFLYSALWFASTSSMVSIVWLHSHLTTRNGLTDTNARAYLNRHTLIAAATGLTWSALAIGYLDQDSLLRLFITLNIVCSITLGGMAPSAEYRPAFVSLSTAMMVPFSLYWLVALDGPVRGIGIGLLFFYGFGLLVSARAEIQTRETLAAERQRKLSARLQAKTEELEKANFAKSRLLAATSHDMSQPLQAQGFLMTALRAYLDKPEQHDMLNRIEAAWRSQKELLDAVLEGARLEGGAVRAQKHSVGLTPLLDDICSVFENEAAQRGVSLRRCGSDMAAYTDPALLARVVRNLTANAVKFTPTGGRVEIWARESGGEVIVEVIDSGPGVSEADHARIFDAYVQLDSEGGDGLGLGLSIVESLAAALEAPLHFISAPGAGTRAGLTLPSTHPDTVQGVEPAASVSPVALGGSPLVLVIEDDVAVRDGLSHLLTEWGCRVIAAQSAEQALTFIALLAATPDFAVIDKRLGDGADGVTALGQVREAVGQSFPAVLLTGDLTGFDAAGTEADLSVLAKPADPDQLRALIASATAQAHQIRV
ncbi:hybrid sensor histidine kinase/response regulator [Oceanicaulis alexandrii]|uniref:hybrid sensor histidine kinase/response regulator n=1 Tax=Oceanicaulis alexandrii TaxID=153233 RepID=UPI0023545602|nr:ATP-binding protein [Oceanicaulis alexandrii]